MKKVIFTIVILLGMAACDTKLMTVGEEKKYPEALFTLGELASAELEMPVAATWWQPASS